MKATVAQINTTPGDFSGNFRRIHNAISTIKGTDVVVFPELTICGYGVKDMIYDRGFVQKNLAILHEIVKSSCEVDFHILVGYIDENHLGAGKPFKNMAAVIYKGVIVATYQKQLLPFYDVFDEGRWFESGNQPCVIKIGDNLCGITICEDLWASDKGEICLNHHNNPLDAYRKIGCDTILNLSSSPYYKEKPNLRRVMLKEIINEKSSIQNIVYCNQYGAQDELVFDGNSMIIHPYGLKFIENPILPRDLEEVSLLTHDLGGKGFCNCKKVSEDEEHLAMTLLGLHDYAKKLNIDKFVVGSSGGIDSAVVIALAAMAFGGEKVHAIKMPSKWSSDHSVNDAVKLHQNLGVNDYEVKIDHDPLLCHVNSSLGMNTENYNFVADENIQARMRGQIVMHFSNATGALAFVTANKTESALGYSTLFGDLAGTFAPIGDLYKLEVYEFANLINKFYGKEIIPQNIIDKAPSAELAPGQTDEASLLPYPILDPLVESYVEYHNDNWFEFVEWVKARSIGDFLDNWVSDFNNKEIFDKMIKRIVSMEFKRRLSPLCIKLTRKSFGTGRRLPIVRK